jgi:hypothetical protein
MKVLCFVYVSVAKAFYDWAAREINPLHPDLPRIMRRQRELEDQAKELFS